MKDAKQMLEISESAIKQHEEKIEEDFKRFGVLLVQKISSMIEKRAMAGHRNLNVFYHFCRSNEVIIGLDYSNEDVADIYKFKYQIGKLFSDNGYTVSFKENEIVFSW